MSSTRLEAPISSDPDRAGHVAEVLKAVAHPLRLRIVALLCERELNVTAIAEELEVSQAIVSQQLRILRSHGLVAASREGGFATYRLVEQNLRRGLARDEAYRAARLKFGSVAAATENYRDERGLPALDATTQDVRYALRALPRFKNLHREHHSPR